MGAVDRLAWQLTANLRNDNGTFYGVVFDERLSLGQLGCFSNRVLQISLDRPAALEFYV